MSNERYGLWKPGRLSWEHCSDELLISENPPTLAFREGVEVVLVALASAEVELPAGAFVDVEVVLFRVVSAGAFLLGQGAHVVLQEFRRAGLLTVFAGVEPIGVAFATAEVKRLAAFLGVVKVPANDD